MASRRALSWALVASSFALPTQAFALTNARTLVTRATTPLAMAAPGVVLSPMAEIQQALANPATIVLDARRVDEIEANGYFQTDRQWVHSPCTPDGDCPLLAVAGDGLLRDKDAPVIVYCASGKRAAVAQSFLQERGYSTVLNAGGYPGDFGELLK